MKLFGKAMRYVTGVLVWSFLVIGMLAVDASASDKHLYVTKDMEEGDIYGSLMTGNLSIQGTPFDKVSVIADSKYFGEYKFEKALDTVHQGNTNYGSIRAMVTGNTTITVFALSKSEDTEAQLVVSNSNGEILDSAIVAPHSSETVTMATFDISASGKNVYIYGSDAPVYIYAVYFGPVTEEDMVAMGKVIVKKDPYYLLYGQYQEEKKEPVFLISFVILLTAVVLFVVILTVKRGRKSVSGLVSVKKTDHTNDYTVSD